jgi:hypothetical protein
MSDDDGLKAMGQVIQIDEARIRDHLGEMVRGTVEETLNALLDAEADRLCGAGRYERSQGRQDTRAGSYERSLHTVAGEVNLKVPKLRRQTFETAIIERYRRRESSVEEALIEMYLAGISVRRVEDITEALWGTRVSPSTVSNLNKKIYAKINLGFTGHIWRTFRRCPKRKFLTQLLDGEPITPKHATSSLQNGIELSISDADRRFFSDFEMFADALNHRFEPNEPWRVQELPDAELTGRRSQTTVVATKYFTINIALETCRSSRGIPTTQIISKSERKLNCSDHRALRINLSTPASYGAGCGLLPSRRTGISATLVGRLLDRMSDVST